MDKTQVLNIIPASPEHVKFVIANLPPEDVAEIEAFGITVTEGVLVSVNHADQVWVLESPEGPVCMWGITKARTLLGSASAWLLTTTLLDKYSRPFIRQVKPYMEKLCAELGEVENYVDSRHERALRFFNWLGFKMENGMLVGPQQIPFYRIYRTRTWV